LGERVPEMLLVEARELAGIPNIWHRAEL
jgi:hypothetical protein